MKEIFQHNSISVNYFRFGSGSNPIFALHGFTQNGLIYKPFEELVNENNYIISMDLFYHGETKISSKNIISFSKEELKDFFLAFFEHLKINQFSVLGYSMGGRLAIFIIEQFTSRIESAYLLAPDGIETSIWTKFVTDTWIGYKFYKFSMNKPSLVFGIAKAGTQLKLFPESIHKFLSINFGSQQIREDVIKNWLLFKNIRFKQDHLIRLISQHQLFIHFVVGHKDPAVQPKILVKFHKKVPQFTKVHIVKAGHDLFKPHVFDYLKKEVF